MPPLVFITGNYRRHEEVARLLGGRPVVQRKLALTPAREGETLADTARRRVLEAFHEVGGPCFLELTEVELEEGPRLSGAELKRRLLAEGEAAIAARLGGKAAVTRVAVGYTPGGGQAHVFEGQLAGRFAPAPRGPAGHGWDRLWIPDGHGGRTLAELGQARYVVTMRNRPYLDLLDLLDPPAGVGTFEAHVTVACADEAALARFEQVCLAEGVKCVHILLPRGATTSHPMTASFHRGTRGEALREVHGLAARIVAAGFEVTRVKLEALGANPEIPASDAEAASRPEGYFELHVKVLVDAGRLDALRSAAEAEGAHPSRNARKLRSDGRAERFVTLRVGGVGRTGAEARFQRLLDALGRVELRVLSVIREYTVHDSNLELDRGWVHA